MWRACVRTEQIDDVQQQVVVERRQKAPQKGQRACLVHVRVGTAANVVAMVNYSQRFVSDHVWIKRAIETGELGKPAFILSVKFDTLSVPTGMIASWAAQTSPLYFMSSHDLDLVHWFLGANPVDVFAQEVRGTLEAQGMNVHDGLNALIQFEGGVSANFHSSWIHPNTYPRVVRWVSANHRQ